MKYIVHLKSTSLTQFSAPMDEDAEKPKKNETRREAQERIFKDRAHYDNKENCIVPGIFFQHSTIAASHLKPEKKQGMETYGKHFDTGLRVVGNIVTKVKRKNIKGLWVFGSSKGKRGGTGGTRVWKKFPVVNDWEGKLMFIVDDDIPLKIFDKTLKISGEFVGVGTHRPANMGDYGTFKVVSIKEA